MDVRLTCTNMLRAAWRRSLMRIAFRHDAHLRADLALYTELFGDIAAGQEQQRQAFQILAETPATPAQVQEVLAATYPEPPRPWSLGLLEALVQRQGADALPTTVWEQLQREQNDYELVVERRKVLQAAGANCYERLCTENPLAAGTAWAACNAAVELVENRAGHSAASSAASALFGERAAERDRAFVAAWALTGRDVLNCGCCGCCGCSVDLQSTSGVPTSGR